MKVALDTEITTLDGTVVKMPQDKSMTVGLACIEALLGTYKDEESLSGKDKYARYGLVRRISKGGAQSFNSEDIVTLKALAAKAWGPLVMGQVWDALEGNEAATSPD